MPTLRERRGEGILLIFPCDIVQPFFTSIVPIHHRHFPEFIETENKVDDLRRQVQHKGAYKTERDGDDPHDDGIADQAEAGVASGAEDAGDGQRVHRLSDYIIGADKQHKIQIILRLRGQVEDTDDRPADEDDDEPGQDTDSERTPTEASRLLSCPVHLQLSHGLSEKHCARAAESIADNREQITDRSGDGGGCHHIGIHVPQYNRIGRKSKSPDTVV